MAIIKTQADYRLGQISANAPAEYDSFAEIANELIELKTKFNLITITDPINLDNVTSELMGTIEDFETSLVTSLESLPDGSLSNGVIGTIENFESSMI